MMDKGSHNIQSKVRNRRVHMANERTFLAWIRTSIGLMAFGFVVEKFGLFVKRIALVLTNAEGLKVQLAQSPDSTSMFGALLVGIGALMGALAFVRYKITEKQIDEDKYQHSLILDVLLAMTVLATGIFLVIYLIHNF